MVNRASNAALVSTGANSNISSVLNNGALAAANAASAASLLGM